MKLLLNARTTNTSGTQDTVSLNNSQMHGKYITIVCYGTFGGCTVTTKFSPDEGTTWIECGSNTTFTAAGAGNLYVSPSGIMVRGDVTNASGTTSVTLGIM